VEIEEEYKLDHHKINLSNTSFQTRAFLNKPASALFYDPTLVLHVDLLPFDV
jgi:hypothetical protein